MKQRVVTVGMLDLELLLELAKEAVVNKPELAGAKPDFTPQSRDRRAYQEAINRAEDSGTLQLSAIDEIV